MNAETWIDRDDFRPAMRDISDALQLGVSDDEISRLEAGLDGMWGVGGPWLTLPNHAARPGVTATFGIDECHGVSISIDGPGDRPRDVCDRIRAKYVECRHSGHAESGA